jgi:antagonist of KipI
VFEVVNPGIMTTVQDLGRPGYSSVGIPLSGAADPFSLKVGNSLVGNPTGEAGLEILLHGLQLAALKKMIISVTGADLGPTLNKEKIPMWRAVEIERGDMISFPSVKVSSLKGCRAYLTVAGGIDVPVILGSKSTCLPGNFGGFKGRALKKGDRIEVGSSILSFSELTNRKFDEIKRANFDDKWEIRVILGPHDHLFKEESIEMFFSQAWRVSYKASRFGVRYIGPKFNFKPRPPHQVKRDPKGDPSNIPSQGVPLGAIEIAGGEEPIAIGVDGPSSTGYTMIATIISADVWKIGQSKPNDLTSFRQVEIDEAYQILIDLEARIKIEDIPIQKQ